jgi:uncharacterized protein (DUF1697 family)
MNAKMPELREAFESAGFTAVRTVLASGNVVFDARSARAASIQRGAEAAMRTRLGQSFLTIVRSLDALEEILASDPYRAFRLAPGAKRIVTFFRDDPPARPALPIEQDGARLLSIRSGQLFGAYLPTPRGPVFMSLIEKNFGKEVTTRTWDTVAKVARA